MDINHLILKANLWYFSRFNFHKDWPRTQYVLNLALVDFLLCTAYPIGLVFQFRRFWHAGETLCKFFAYLYYSFMFIEWMSMAMVASSCAIVVTKPKLMYKKIFTKRARNFILISTWFYGFVLLLPTQFGVRSIRMSNNFNFCKTLTILGFARIWMELPYRNLCIYSCQGW